jgi:hypothetical protein
MIATLSATSFAVLVWTVVLLVVAVLVYTGYVIATDAGLV